MKERQVLPKRDHSKLALPHIEGNEVKLEKVEAVVEEAKRDYEPEVVEAWDGRKVTLIGRGEDLSVPLPIYHRNGTDRFFRLNIGFF